MSAEYLEAQCVRFRPLNALLRNNAAAKKSVIENWCRVAEHFCQYPNEVGVPNLFWLAEAWRRVTHKIRQSNVSNEVELLVTDATIAAVALSVFALPL